MQILAKSEWGDNLKLPAYLNYPGKIKPGTNKWTRFRFWRWYLTTAVLNLVDVENMPHDMETSFKLSVLLGGRAVFFRRENNVWCLPFSDGGEVPVYYGEIVRVLCTNPVLGEFNGTPGTDCECVYLTPLDRVQMGCGYSWLIDDTADTLSDNDISVKCAQFLKRLPTVFVGHTDQERAAMDGVIENVEDGNIKIVAQSALNKSIERLDAAQSTVSPLSEFTEYQQYKLGQFYGMLGVNTVWNTKRERVAASENETSGETARYNIADVLENLNLQLDRVNAMFGTDYHCKLSLIKSAEIDAEIDAKKPETNDETEVSENDDIDVS